jgi:hypothetical protein
MSPKIEKEILAAAKRESEGRWSNFKGGAKLALVHHMQLLGKPMEGSVGRDHKEEKMERKIRWRRAMQDKSNG